MYTIIGIVYVIDVWSQEYVIVSIFPEVYPGEANTNLIQTSTLWCRTKNFYYLIKCDCADFCISGH